MNWGPECDFSFQDLYAAAFGKDQKEFTEDLSNLPQKKINVLVKTWAKKANWETEDRVGSDNMVYTAFYPKPKK